MKEEKQNEEKGFSLLELVLALALGLIILGALITSFIAQRTTYDYQEQVVEMAQTARAALDMISREVMMAGYNPTAKLQKTDATAPDYSGIVYHLDQLEIRADLGTNGVPPGNGIIVTNPGDPEADWIYEENERIVYFLEDDVLLMRQVGRGTPQPFAENVKTFSVQYLDGGSSTQPPLPTTNSPDIRQLKISIEIETEKAGIGRGFGETKAEAVVDVRNMGMNPHSGTTLPLVTTTTGIPPTTTTGTGTTTTTGTETTTTIAVTTTSTSSSTTTTTYFDVTPPDTDLNPLGDKCLGKEYYVSVDACLEEASGIVKTRVYVAQLSGGKYTSYNNAVIAWFVTGGPDVDEDGIVDERPLEFQYHGWYGKFQSYCSCGSFSQYKYCDASTYLVAGGGNPHVTLKVMIPKATPGEFCTYWLYDIPVEIVPPPV